MGVYDRNRAAVGVARRRRKTDVHCLIQEYKVTLACVDCGEDHPATLDFHHLDPSTKERSLGDIAKYGWSRKKALAEIAKCVILCANCHRTRHWPGVNTAATPEATEFSNVAAIVMSP